MIRTTTRLLVLVATAACVVPFASAQDVAPATRAAEPLPTLLTPKDLQKTARYTHSAFEMTVNPPIDTGDGVFVESLKYASPVTSSDPDRNDVVRGRLFRIAEPEKAAVIALGGWKFDPLTPELSRELAKTGIQVVWLEIPYQGQRTPQGERPGALTLSDDLAQNEKTFVQLAQDVGRVRHWLVHERGVDPDRIGLLGTSLGGFAAATLYGMFPGEFSAVTVQIAGSDIVSVLFNGNWLTRKIEEGLAKRGIDAPTARKLVQGMNPSTWADPERKDGVLLVAAELDEIVPLHTVEDLRDRYDGAAMIVMEGAPHRAAEGLRDAFPKVRAHFQHVLLPGNSEPGETR